MDVSEEIAIRTVSGDADRSSWAAFLARSSNGTLFHDLDFLDYHPAGKYCFRHLIFHQGDKIVALLPGGMVTTPGGIEFHSPLGASVGGFVVESTVRSELLTLVFQRLQRHAREQGWSAIELTLAPAAYSHPASQAVEFAAFCNGFRQSHRWLSHMLSLRTGAGFETTLRGRQASYVRAARRRGLLAVERGVDGLDDFLKVFQDTFERHGVRATHTAEEIRTLLERFPQRIRLHLALQSGYPAAGLLLMRLTESVVYAFYNCTSREHADQHGVAFLLAELIDRLPQDGVRILDLGPSASDMNFNRGVVYFKEGLGAFGQCRDRWRWEPQGV